MENHESEDDELRVEHNSLEPKGVSISVSMLVKRHLPPAAKDWPQQKIFDALNRVTHVRLDREHINQIDSLEMLGNNVTNLYLQQNLIQRVENLGCLQSLSFLTLAGNKITAIKGVSCLRSLSFLDLSENYIKAVDTEELPQSLIVLNLKGNACTEKHDHRCRLIQHLRRLQQLDLERVSVSEKRDAGYEVSSGSEDSLTDEEKEEEGRTVQEEDGQVDSLTGSIAAMTTDILLRSQSRLEDMWQQHQRTLHTLMETRLVPPPGDQTETKNKQV